MRLSRFWLASAFPLFTAWTFVRAQSPLSPDQARQSFEIVDELSIELVAAEPLVSSPCAMAFDERGRLFVAENRGYPQGPREGQPPVGAIALLEDTDGNGQMDKRTVFAEQLTFPNGIMPWKGGLIVTCAPEILYFRDSDGDGRADERQVLLTGFDTAKSTQLRVNQPLLGLDGWIWLASGLTGGRITNPRHPEFGALDLKSDIRFHPESGRFEAVDGRSQYGHSFDDFGRRFICMNRIQVQHVVLPSDALRRNPHFAFSDTVQNCPDLVPNPLLRGGGGAARIFPISSNITTADSHAGTFSAACAVTIWPGGSLPASYRGTAFSCDPTGNLVHVDRLEQRGATFAASPVTNGREFLASRDDWFRPVALSTGPEGALYICDMYRKVIEHPDYLPVEVRKHTDFEAGRDHGRIWRVSLKNSDRPAAKFGNAEPVSSLLTRLASEDGWERQTAFRLLTEHRNALASEDLSNAFRNTSEPVQAAALLALLSQQSTPDDKCISAALEHQSAGVRELALKLAPIHKEVMSRAGDNDPRVRFQCALALGENKLENRARALAQIARLNPGDRWTRAAILCSSSGIEEPLLSAILESYRPPEVVTHQSNVPLDFTILHDLAQILGKRLPADRRSVMLEQLLSKAGTVPHEASFALASGFLSATGPLPDVNTNSGFEAVVNEALKFATAKGGEKASVLAIDLLGFASYEKAAPALAEALGAADMQAQLAAVRALSRFQERAAAELLLEPKRWAQFPPAIREAILNAMVSRPRLIQVLLDVLENQSFPANAVDSLRRQQLQKHSDSAIRQRATKLFAQPASGDRMRSFESAKAALALKPHPANGREVFRKLCASCHRIEREGAAVGPDLFDIRNQPKESILLHIVVPDHEIAPGFAAYIVELKDGRILSGVVSSETAESITLRQPGGQEESISRSSVSTLTASPVSLMPSGLEQVLKTQELADLIAYLRGEQ